MVKSEIKSKCSYLSLVVDKLRLLHDWDHVGVWNSLHRWLRAILPQRLLLLRKRNLTMPELNITTLWLLDITWHQGSAVRSNLSRRGRVHVDHLGARTRCLGLDVDWLLTLRNHLLSLGHHGDHLVAHLGSLLTVLSLYDA